MPSLRSKRFRGVWEHRKTKEWDFRYFACAENRARAEKIKIGIRGRKETLADKPLDFENPVGWRTGPVIGWASRTLLTYVDQRY